MVEQENDKNVSKEESLRLDRSNLALKIMTDEQRILELENFLKEAFCIDGDCKYKQFDTLVSQKEGTSEKVMTFILDDTKRGKFKVCVSNGG